MENNSIYDDLAKAAEKFLPPIKDLDERYILIKDGYKVVKKEVPAEYLTDKPKRLILSQNIKNKADYIDFVKEYQTEQTKISYNDNVVRTIFNYSAKDEGDFNDSYAILKLEQTSQFETLKMFLDKNKINQKEFVQIIKQLESAITSHPAIELVELAQNLQSIKKINSSMTNSSRQIQIDAEIKSGKGENITLPSKLTFKFPVFKNDLEKKSTFEVELYADFDDDFGLNLVCYRLDEIVEETVRELMSDMLKELEGIKAYQI